MAEDQKTRLVLRQPPKTLTRQDPSSAAARLAELARSRDQATALEQHISNLGEDVAIKIFYNGVETEVSVPVPVAAISYCFSKGEIPSVNEVMRAIAVLEEARQRVLSTAQREDGDFDPLHLTTARVFEDARDTHIVNLMFEARAGDRVNVRQGFSEEFRLSELEPLIQAIAATLLQESPEALAKNRDLAAVLEHVTRPVVNMDGLDLESVAQEVKQRIRKPVDASHVEIRESAKRLVKDTVDLKNVQVSIPLLGEHSISVQDALEKLLFMLPQETRQKYGDRLCFEMLRTYLNARYLIGAGKEAFAEYSAEVSRDSRDYGKALDSAGADISAAVRQFVEDVKGPRRG